MLRAVVFPLVLLALVPACGPDGLDAFESDDLADDGDDLDLDMVPFEANDSDGDEGGEAGEGAELPPRADMPEESDTDEPDLWCCNCETGFCSKAIDGEWCIEPVNGGLDPDAKLCELDPNGFPADCFAQC